MKRLALSPIVFRGRQIPACAAGLRYAHNNGIRQELESLFGNPCEIGIYCQGNIVFKTDMLPGKPPKALKIKSKHPGQECSYHNIQVLMKL